MLLGRTCQVKRPCLPLPSSLGRGVEPTDLAEPQPRKVRLTNTSTIGTNLPSDGFAKGDHTGEDTRSFGRSRPVPKRWERLMKLWRDLQIDKDFETPATPCAV